MGIVVMVWLIVSSDHEIVSSRWIAAPVERVFASFTDPKVLEKWWGPEGFTNEVTKFEFLVGGEWEITMRSPDGTEFPNVSRFVEIVPDEKIIYDHIEPVHAFTMIMTFDGKDGCCLLTWSMNFVAAGEADRLREFITAANEQNFDRLEAVVQPNT